MKVSLRLPLFAVVASLSFGTTGCTNYFARFSPPIKQESTVVLREDDFEYVARDLRGDYGYWTIGVPGMVEIPLGDPRLFSNAMADMYAPIQYEAEGRPTQLINWKYDQNDLFLVVLPFAYSSATFRADMIEYTKQ